MIETKPSSQSDRADRARSLAATLVSTDADLAAVLIDVLDRMNALLAIKDIGTGRCVHANAGMAALFGRSAQEMVGTRDADLMEANQLSALRSAEQAALSQATPVVSEHRIERGGQRREFSVIRGTLPGSDGGAARHLVSVWIELTATRQRDAQLQQALVQLEQQQIAAETLRRETQDLALRDGATGLYQRVHFDDQLRREVDLSSREHREFALVTINLDPLSDEARALGAGARTRVLEALGRLLRSNTRAMDASCRLSEDRFAVLLSGVGLATAHSRMEGLRRQCATQIVVLEGRDLGFTVSMGVASFPHTAHTQQELMQAADLALIEAQKRGGNHVTLASIRFEPA